jgi:DHA3 family multidrug efflux protein-like MFS transporter
MGSFLKLLGITLLVAATNNFVWFAIVFWLYLETGSVIATSTVGGMYMIMSAASSFWFGSIVDHNKKKFAMMGSSIATLFFFTLGFLVYNIFPESAFSTISSPTLWIFVFILLLGSISGSVYQIAVPTLVGVVVDEDKRDKANGMFGTVMGIAFGITSVGSGLVLGFLSMWHVLLFALIGTLIAIICLLLPSIPEKKIIHTHVNDENSHEKVGKIDIKGTIAVIKKVPGLFPLILFTTFNNLIGGVFMALMDAYGLSLVSVQVWGLIWGVLSFGFIIGGLYIAKKGLGDNPLRSLFRINLFMWTLCIVMTIQPSVILLVICLALWMPMMPFVEATEQTIFQKVVPPERLGRVFGFAHSVEQSASPLTSFIIGPIAQIVFIPFMTTGKGVELIGSWFGVGTGRGIALVFITAGILGLGVTYLAMKSKSYSVLSERYNK